MPEGHLIKYCPAESIARMEGIGWTTEVDVAKEGSQAIS